ncbi:PD40 domain-containing protein [Vulgatibacter incomptus]|uniref:AglU n=1 Tax=Vulgatibacter incomptus TaxID=1391653 RepID=A0A0K1PBG3_9BACT|nr:PD40 domain-containing protein [Vulgatibacter incomptus]AKU90741.1 AglU [Vulgatibacter incomptus]
MRSPFFRSCLLPAILAAVVVAGCKAPPPKAYQGEGKLVAAGPAREVIAAPDGGAVAWLAAPDLAKDKGHNASDQTFIGTATFAPMGAPVTMGPGVATLPGSFFFSPTGAQVGALTRWSFKLQRGTLVVGDVAQSRARTVAEQVSFFAFSSDGARLGYVAENVLFVGPADGSRPAERIAEQIATFDFSPDGKSLVARRRALGGGQLVHADLEKGGEPRIVGEKVADYRWSPDGSRVAFTARNDEGTADLFVEKAGAKAERVGKGVTAFRYAPDGKHLAFIGDVTPKKQFGDLFVLGEDGAAVKIGEDVTELDFDPKGRRLAWLDKYNPHNRGGVLTWAELSAKPEARKLGSNVPSFVWSHDGSRLAYVQRQLAPVFSIDLYLATVGAEGDPAKVAQGVFGYSFATRDDRLYFRTQCIRNGRACDLQSVDVAHPAGAVRMIAKAIHTFEPADADESTLLVTYARTDADALDLAMVPADGSSKPRMLDERVLAGTKILRGGKARVAYAVLDPARLGVYVADAPAFDATAEGAR